MTLKESIIVSKIKIESGIPYPAPTIPPLPLENMKVGDSFKLTLKNPEKEKSVVRQRLSRFQEKNEPARFSMRSISKDEIRVYRMEDYK